MDTRDLEARLRRAVATYERAVPTPSGLERRIFSRIAVTSTPKQPGRDRSQPVSVKSTALAQLFGVAAAIALAVAIGFTVLYTRGHAPTGAPAAWNASGWWQAYFADATTGWFVESAPAAAGSTDHSVLYGTTDGGRDWQRLSSVKGDLGPLWVRGSEMLAMRTQSVGGPGCVENLLHSSDKGVHWTVRPFPSSISDVEPVFLPDLRNGWLIDFGGSLVACAPPGRLNLPVGKLPSSRGVLWRTSDGGQSWVQAASLDTFGIKVGGPVKVTTWNVDSAAVLLGGTSPSGRFLFVTHDRGKHWQVPQVPSPVGNAQAQLEPWIPTMFDDRNGLLEGNPPTSPTYVKGEPSSTYVLRTEDGGTHWSVPTQIDLPNGATGGLQFLSDRRWIVTSGFGQVYVTNDYGQHWQEVAPPDHRPNWTITFEGPELGVANLGPSKPGGGIDAVYQTIDGGLHWQRIELPAGSSP
jgi:photosystem II stability/assembly factor-like uncharacterized protein